MPDENEPRVPERENEGDEPRVELPPDPDDDMEEREEQRDEGDQREEEIEELERT